MTNPAPGPFSAPVIPFDPPVVYNPYTGLYNGQTLLQALQSGNRAIEISAASIAAQSQQWPPTDVTITIYSKTYQPLGVLNDYISMEAIFPRNRVGTATIVLKSGDIEPFYQTLVNCWVTTVPITIQIGSLRWSGRVWRCHDQMKEGINTMTLELKDDYSWLDHILCWPDFLLPIEIQFPSRALYIGPAITCIKTLIAEQAFRLQSGIWELVNNLGGLDLDWTAWFGTVLESNGNLLEMLMTPIVVVPVNPIFDTSQWVSFSGRMDKCSTLIDQVVTDLGLLVTCNLWLPGDPQPAGMIIPLQFPCIVVDVRDRSGVVGPTGTLLDGLLRNTLDLQHSIFGNILTPFLNPGAEFAPPGINIAPTFGVNFVPPWVIFTDHPRSGLREYDVVFQTPQAFTVVGGGKSPQWINDLINLTLEWIIDAIEIAVGFTGIPSDLLDGTFDDVILAFQQIENGPRRIQMGPFGWPEYFAQTGSSAYTLDEWFALQGAMWDTRGFPMFSLKHDNGFPYTAGVDYFPGSLVSFVRKGQLYTDYVDSFTYRDNRKDRAKVDMVVGDILPLQNPIVKLQRKITEFEEAFQIITMSTN